VRVERLRGALDRAARLGTPQLENLASKQAAAPRSHVAARLRDTIKLIPVREVFYFNADQKYTSVRHQGGTDLIEDSLRALEEALLEFAGSVLVISHDRWFLDRIATHILAFEGDSRVVFFPGNYHEYEADKLQRLGAEAAQPKRIRFKPLK